ncbi:MAG TPA: PEGA domain-containing protein [Vicinamibacterales bacterium]|nr:PEGA domain-containing protein [Vicinamibacterales bacterium]
MSAPATDLTSISSSGLEDGLGRRLLAFDRETGTMLERLCLRPELAAFEGAICERVARLTAFEDERFARPIKVERDAATGEVTVLSEFVAGNRLSDVLETAYETATVPGVDVALGFLLEVLPALSTFHSVLSFPHGLIDPTRIVARPAGQVVLLDSAFGHVVERLMLSRSRLWAEFGIAAPSSDGPVRFDPASDVAQVVLSAVALVLGRRLEAVEFPDSLPLLLMEVVEVAQIRAGASFASGLQRILQRSLPLPGRRPYNTSDEIVAELRQLARRDIGLDVCRQALLDFVEQTDAGGASIPAGSDATVFEDPAETASNYPDYLESESFDIGVGPGSDVPLVTIEVVDEDAADTSTLPAADFESATEEPEQELPLDSLDLGAAAWSQPEPVERHPLPGEDPLPATPSADLEETRAAEAAAAEEALSGARHEPTVRAAESPDTAVSQPPPPEEQGTDAGVAAEADHSSASRRRKRQQRSARARKDKLRSTAASSPQSIGKPEVPQGRPSSPWIVNPARASSFEPPVPQPVPETAPPEPARVAPVQPVFHPPPPLRMPVFPQPGSPPAPPSPTPAPPPAAVTVNPPSPSFPVSQSPAAPARVSGAGSVGLRLKSEERPGQTPVRLKETVSALPYVQRGPLSMPEEPRPFPWKLAAAVLIVVGIAIVAGRAYLPSRGTPDETTAADTPVEPPVVVVPSPETGEIVIQTQPAGAMVLLDGKPVGESPLKLTAVPAGRHVLTFTSSSGEVTRTVRVGAGQTLDVDVPIFSGWVAIFAPIVLEVSLNGRSLGTTEQDRLMLPPGRHSLTLTNRDLGYRAIQGVDVEAGEVRSITIDPRGPVNLNAIPWAEVWLGGQKLGETPLADLRVPLGVQEFVFKHPELGERTSIATVRADEPTAISIDFTVR